MSFEEYDLQDVAKTLTWIFLVFPHFALSHGLSNLNMITMFNQVCDTACNLTPLCTSRELICQIAPIFNVTAPCCGNDYFDFDNYGIGRNLMFLFLVGLFSFIVLLLNEYGVIATLFYSIKSCFTKFTLSTSDDTIDSNVLEEKEKVRNMSKSEAESYNLVVNGMSKVYGNFVAVNNISVAVEQ